MKKTLLTLVLTLIGIHTTFAQIGIGTIEPDASAQLELQSTAKGFLPPRMDTDARDGIGSPAEGLTIYNTDNKCLEVFDSADWISICDGSVVTSPPQPQLGSNFTNGFEDNQTCENKLISVTPCSAIDGASINDDPDTADGIEYDWADADSFMNGGTTRALVEIGGQCWFRRNTTTESTHTGTNDSDGFYNNNSTESGVGEGRLYQWEAAMNGVSGTAAERAQGVCPTGWHVPSDCEWMYLENSLGMSTTDQEDLNNRNSGSVGSKLSTLTDNGTNSSGFTALLAGYSYNSGSSNRGSEGFLWSSSEVSANDAHRRFLESSQAGVNRVDAFKSVGFSVRCLKD